MTNTPTLAAGGRMAPARLVLVRHAQSVGNVADEYARANGLPRLELTTRDPDTPLSEQGNQQAEALGRHLAALPKRDAPDVVLVSPFVRARQTAEIALSVSGLSPHLVMDERLRERDLGILDGYTRRGIEQAFPEEAERRNRLGKFYYRPAGGESWCDVALRVRSLMRDVAAEHSDRIVWAFSHQAVIMSFRLVLESLDETRVLEAEAATPLPNVSLTTYDRDEAGALALTSYALTDHVEASPAEVTAEPSSAEVPA